MTILIAVGILAVAGTVILGYIRTDLILKPEKLPNVNHPGLFGLRYEKIIFHTSDGLELSGWWIPSVDGASNKTILMCHGWGTNSSDILSSTWYLAREGFNLFYFDFRGCGDSPQRGLSSLGYFERKDLEAALKYLKEMRPDASLRIGIFGLSMGASVTLAASSGMFIPVEAAFLEAPFWGFNEVVARYIRYFYKAPRFPLAYMYLVLLYVRSAMADHEGVSPHRHVSQCRIPRVFLVYGERDWLASVSDGEILLEGLKKSNAVNRAELWAVPDAGHADCFGRHPGVYREKLVQFFRSALV